MDLVKQDTAFDRTLALFAECPDCDALVLSYASSHHSPTIAENEDRWTMTCDRCGAKFDIPGDELLLRSIPASWLLSTPDWAN